MQHQVERVDVLEGINDVTNRKTKEEFEEITQFKKLQAGFAEQFKHVFPDKMSPKTVIIIPSLTLDPGILSKIRGISHYEERMLCMLMLLRMPLTRIIFVSSMPIDPIIVDYYLHLLPGITGYHARQRLTLLSCFDASKKSLTEKILERPRLIELIKRNIPLDHQAHISCFNVTPAERKLAVKLHAPVYGCDPDLEYLGNKSFGRKIFRDCNINIPTGFEDLRSEDDIAVSLLKLREADPSLDRAVIKINEGFSGEGNALFYYEGCPQTNMLGWIKEQMRNNLHIVADKVSYSDFMNKFQHLGGIVEEFVKGDFIQSPSVQCRITPLGTVDVISTHDQLTGGEGGQVFLGATFPAYHEYAVEIGEMGRSIAGELKKYGVLGRFSIDFISVKKGNAWHHYAIEINLRKGGTTHPYLMLLFLTDGKYDAATGTYQAANGQNRYYVCSDNLQSEFYKGLTPHDLIEIAMCNDLLYSESSQEGVMFHLISSLSQYGKAGVVCIGSTPDRAKYFYQKAKEVLDKEGARQFTS